MHAVVGRNADPSMREFAKEWFTTVQELLDTGKVKPHPQRIMEGGIPAVLNGLELIRKKKASGQKVVYPVDTWLAERQHSCIM